MGIEKWEELVTEIVNKEKMKDIAQRTPLKPEDVNTALMSLAKSLFDNMFNWLVAKMNLTI
jgi:myosin heavy subunit